MKEKTEQDNDGLQVGAEGEDTMVGRTTMVLPPSIGDKVERFYLAYRDGEKQIEALLDALYFLETHVPIFALGETKDVVLEIVTDCQKKAVQLIRAPCSEEVRTIIQTIRKKLASKVSLDVDVATGQQHGQRHLNFLLELLGSWSNIVARIQALGISRTSLRLAISPLHARVIEMAFECFEKFKEDKNLDSWHKKVIEMTISQSSGGGGGGGGGTASSSSLTASQALDMTGGGFNITSLDYLISQMGAMRDIVMQYYRFLVRTLTTAEDYGDWVEQQLAAADVVANDSKGQGDDKDPLGQNVKTSSIDCTPTSSSSSPSSQLGLLCSQEERNRWRELDAIYISLEMAYLSRSIREALQEPSLLEVEGFDSTPTGKGKNDSKGGWSSANGSMHADGNATLAANTAVLSGGGGGIQGDANVLNGGAFSPQAVEDVFSLLQRVGERAVSTGSEASVFAVGNKIVEILDQPHGDGNMMMMPGTTTAGRDYSEPITLFGLLQTTRTFRSCVKNKAIRVRTAAATSGAVKGGPPKLARRKSGGGLFDDLMSALESDVLGDYDEDEFADSTRPLLPVDAAVQLTAWATALCATTALAGIFRRAAIELAAVNMEVETKSSHRNSISGGGRRGGRSSPIDLICAELNRCGLLYARSLQQHAAAFARTAFELYLLPQLISSFIGKSAPSQPFTSASSSLYDIDGDTMERRTGQCDFLRTLRALLAPTLHINQPNPLYSFHGSSSSIGGGPKAVGLANSASGEILNLQQSDFSSGFSLFAEDNTRQSESALRLFADVLARKLSSVARNEVLCQLATMVVESLMGCVLDGSPYSSPINPNNGFNPSSVNSSRGVSSSPSSSNFSTGMKFSEWGAMLFHQEMMAVASAFEQGTEESASEGVPHLLMLCSSPSSSGCGGGGGGGGGGGAMVGTSVRGNNANGTDRVTFTAVPPSTSGTGTSKIRVKTVFSPLVWCLKLLSLDQPGDLRRYNIPAGVFGMGSESGSGPGTGTGPPSSGVGSGSGGGVGGGATRADGSGSGSGNDEIALDINAHVPGAAAAAAATLHAFRAGVSIFSGSSSSNLSSSSSGNNLSSLSPLADSASTSVPTTKPYGYQVDSDQPSSALSTSASADEPVVHPLVKFTEDRVRQILSKRTDFSREAIARVKISVVAT